MEPTEVGAPRASPASKEMTVTQGILACRVTRVTPARLETQGRLGTGDCQATLEASDQQDPRDPMGGRVYLEVWGSRVGLDRMGPPDNEDLLVSLGWM